MKYSILILAAASLWCAEEFTRTIEKSFSLSGGARSVFVCGINGPIKVTAADASEVRFTVHEKLRAPDQQRLDEMKRYVDVVFTQESGGVRAGVKGPWSDRDCSNPDRTGRNESNRRWDDWRDMSWSHEFIVTVPRNAQIELRSVNGSIDVNGTSGAYKVTTVNGGVRMTDVEGSGELSTVNGTVQAVYKSNPPADSKFRTVNGKLDLYFQPSLSADFTLKTLNGKAYTDFDMTSIPLAAAASEETRGMKVIHRRGTTGALRAGSGGPKFSMETVNGSILIHSLAKGRPQ
ncbi:MAG: hypothetical protein HYX27_25800 [Acidobacteria bacterium]|nr:hypothetical protein [Acidobacteriota bacterium]